MVQVGRAMSPAHRVLFMGYEDDYVGLIRDAGFEYTACAPAFTAGERERLIAFDQGRTFRSPLTEELVGARVAVERRIIRDTGTGSVVTGSNLTSFISARAEGVPLYYPVRSPSPCPR